MHSKPSRGDVFWVDLNPVIGSEQGNRRPCLIVSPDALNRIERNNTVVVLPITSKGGANALRVEVGTGQVAGFALVQQQRAIDKRRLIEPAGTISAHNLEVVLTQLRSFYT